VNPGAFDRIVRTVATTGVECLSEEFVGANKFVLSIGERSRALPGARPEPRRKSGGEFDGPLGPGSTFPEVAAHDPEEGGVPDEADERRRVAFAELPQGRAEVVDIAVEQQPTHLAEAPIDEHPFVDRGKPLRVSEPELVGSERSPPAHWKTGLFAPGAGYVWICECTNNHAILRYDRRTSRAKPMQVATTPQNWRDSDRLRYAPRTFIAGFDGRTGIVWFFGGVTASSGGSERPGSTALGRPVRRAGSGDNGQHSVWAAGSTVANRLTVATGERDVIALPKG